MANALNVLSTLAIDCLFIRVALASHLGEVALASVLSFRSPQLRLKTAHIGIVFRYFAALASFANLALNLLSSQKLSFMENLISTFSKPLS
jgi:hypothetical protein